MFLKKFAKLAAFSDVITLQPSALVKIGQTIRSISPIIFHKVYPKTVKLPQMGYMVRKKLSGNCFQFFSPNSLIMAKFSILWKFVTQFVPHIPHFKTAIFYSLRYSIFTQYLS